MSTLKELKMQLKVRLHQATAEREAMEAYCYGKDSLFKEESEANKYLLIAELNILKSLEYSLQKRLVHSAFVQPEV